MVVAVVAMVVVVLVVVVVVIVVCGGGFEGFCYLKQIETKDLLASDVISGMKMLSEVRRHMPQTCLICIPIKVFT